MASIASVDVLEMIVKSVFCISVSNISSVFLLWSLRTSSRNVASVFKLKEKLFIEKM